MTKFSCKYYLIWKLQISFMTSSLEFLIIFLLKLMQSLKLHVLKLSNNIEELNRQLVSHMFGSA